MNTPAPSGPVRIVKYIISCAAIRNLRHGQ